MLAPRVCRSGLGSLRSALSSKAASPFFLRSSASAVARPFTAFQWRAANFYSTKRFTKQHEYVNVDGEVGTVGISEYAAHALGEVVFVELPEQGSSVDAGNGLGSVESVKSASDVYSPVSGEITEVNATLSDSPEKVGLSPESEGWLCKIKLSSPEEVKGLLTKEAYDEFCNEEDASH
ncbi:glycine decarboxylase complex subunit H [Schizosaccharomyces cryophilus OY26]|uniref:Glycine cleavage system H protein n=1 Tax=Schizosaccharomyces cryophilus (strain OY26 / ATCC MYA-4695 / CBS 11777 / NBRC 106824 / NRRL Y48691) TaxID=653667 RepID=S9XJG2_SCHCR|nr:glycine decarboxylase complex subunit H [Schizosaccharomyces cryophilus OY26]EPY53826.1 glycine decarboxylase complex subunit H [Schizosaccharomyces cryophilus OY26]